MILDYLGGLNIITMVPKGVREKDMTLKWSSRVIQHERDTALLALKTEECTES